jgi:hypothetical protein
LTEIELDIVAGPVRAIPIPATFTDVLLIAGPCELCGFSIRDALAETPLETEGTVAAPGALSTICSIANVPAGTYTVNWLVQLAGTPAAADANNFQLVNGATGLVLSANQGAVGEYPQDPVEIVVPAVQTVKIVNIGAATAGSIYTAQLALIPVTQALSVAELQDGNNPLLELGVPSGSADTRYFGTGSIHVRNRINYHPVSGLLTGSVFVRYQKNTG